jgi:hypothetical protein
VPALDAHAGMAPMPLRGRRTTLHRVTSRIPTGPGQSCTPAAPHTAAHYRNTPRVGRHQRVEHAVACVGPGPELGLGLGLGPGPGPGLGLGPGPGAGSKHWVAAGSGAPRCTVATGCPPYPPRDPRSQKRAQMLQGQRCHNQGRVLTTVSTEARTPQCELLPTSWQAQHIDVEGIQRLHEARVPGGPREGTLGPSQGVNVHKCPRIHGQMPLVVNKEAGPGCARWEVACCNVWMGWGGGWGREGGGCWVGVGVWVCVGMGV